ncbi:MAG: long-chain fatty acid transport protein [bacterium]|nr:MAG: long-chain fatty acid transport protein [bacterium]
MAVRFLRITVLLLFALLIVGPSSAQDNRYSELSYGTEATLLNGAVIGRTLDMSAAFYNPAGIATIDNPSLVLGAHTYEYGGVKINGTDEYTQEPLSVGSTSLRPAPSFIGGTIPFSSLGRHRIAYSVLTRQTAEARIAYRQGVEENGQRIQLEYLNENDLSENWVGLSWAYGFSDKAAVGATMFTAVRSQLLRRQITGQVLHEDNSVGLAGRPSTTPRRPESTSTAMAPRIRGWRRTTRRTSRAISRADSRSAWERRWTSTGPRSSRAPSGMPNGARRGCSRRTPSSRRAAANRSRTT